MRQFDNTIFKLDVHLQSVEPNLSKAVSRFDREVLDLISQKYSIAAVLETLAAIGFEALEDTDREIKEDGLVLTEEEKALCKQEIYQDLLLYAASAALNTEENDVRVTDSYIV